MYDVHPVRLQEMRLPRNNNNKSKNYSPGFPVEAFSRPLLNVLEEPRTVEATGVPEEFIANLALKIIYFNGTMKGWQVAQAMRLNFSGVIDPVLQELKLQHLVQVTGSKDLSRTSFQYAITEKGASGPENYWIAVAMLALAR